MFGTESRRPRADWAPSVAAASHRLGSGALEHLPAIVPEAALLGASDTSAARGGAVPATATPPLTGRAALTGPGRLASKNATSSTATSLAKAGAVVVLGGIPAALIVLRRRAVRRRRLRRLAARRQRDRLAA